MFLPSLGRKVDTKALPESVDVSSTSSSSLTALERVVASVWEAIRALSKCSNKRLRGFAEGPDQCFFSAKEVLKRSGVGPNDHFLALGGHSMSVLQASSEDLGTFIPCHGSLHHKSGEGHSKRVKIRLIQRYGGL